MTRRPGLTMTELLVAIFVVAIGLAGVMSMVPFGAKQMSDALVADRATSHAHTVDGMMRSIWKEKVIDDATGNGSNEKMWRALDNPSADLVTPRAGVPAAVAATDTGPSYPVFVDPLGVARSGSPAEWVGDNAETFVPRRTLSEFSNADNAVRAWSQPDGFSWDEDSQPAGGAVVNREYRYNALAVVQRPVNSQRNTATLKIVVFSNRRPRFFPTGTESVVTGVTFTPRNTAIQIPTASVPAASEVRKGGWIMDATMSGTVRHANFYRVVSVLENTAGTLDIELHTAIKRVDGGTNAYTATLVLLPGVAGVFERPLMTANP